MKKSNLILVTVVAAILASGVSTAAPIYMKYDGVQASVSHEGHGGWIEVGSVQWGAPLPAPPPAPAPAGVAEKGPGRVVVVKKLDKSSPVLKQAAASRKVVPLVQFDVPRGTAPGPDPYMHYELKNVMITSYSVSGQGSGDPIPTESISFNFDKLTLKHAEQKIAPKNPAKGVQR